MKNRYLFIINSLVLLLVLVLAIIFPIVFEINKPAGLIIHITLSAFSVIGLLFSTFYLSKREIHQSSIYMVLVGTYLFQLLPFAVFFMLNDDFVNSWKIIFPILLAFLFLIAYVGFMVASTHYNKVAVEDDKKLEGKKIEVQQEESYYNEDGSFKGSK